MPIYEYRCADCDRTSSAFVRSVSAHAKARCSHCNSRRLTRLMSKVSRVKTAQDVLDALGAPPRPGAPQGIDDPRQIGRWVERRFDELGMSVPDDVRQQIDAAREGDLPGPVKDL